MYVPSPTRAVLRLNSRGNTVRRRYRPPSQLWPGSRRSFVGICSHSVEPVPEAAYRDDPLRLRRVALELAAEVRDVRVAGSLVARVAAVPEMAHDVAPRGDIARRGREQRQQAELRPRQ